MCVCVFSFLVLAIAENREIKGSIGGVAADSTADKVWLVLQAVGDIAFAYPYMVILLEIQVCSLCLCLPSAVFEVFLVQY